MSPVRIRPSAQRMNRLVKKAPKQNQERKQLIQALATSISTMSASHPLRVVIDGVDTSGKITLADELINPLEKTWNAYY